jgi:SAM-dependent methyltransferase
MDAKKPVDGLFQRALDQLAGAPHPPASPGWPNAGEPVGAREYQMPWDDPGFSARMLAVHLDPDTHMASRRPETIDRHVSWLANHLADRGLVGSRVHILDVGCGPGLYQHQLARRGFRTTGFDFAPAPVAHARKEAARQGLDCRFFEMDLTRLPEDFAGQVGPVDAITFWFGEFHSFGPELVDGFLPRLAEVLRPGGVFVLEYQPLNIFFQEDSTQWSWQEESVFCPRPHLWLQEFGWDPRRLVETHVHWIVERDSGKLHRYVQCHQAWTDEDLVARLEQAGFVDPVFYPPITEVDEEFEFPIISTRRA